MLVVGPSETSSIMLITTTACPNPWACKYGFSEGMQSAICSIIAGTQPSLAPLFRRKDTSYALRNL
jgi:hypothetical protein